MKPSQEHLSIRRVETALSEFVFRIECRKKEDSKQVSENLNEVSIGDQQPKDKVSSMDSHEQVDSKEEHSITSEKTCRNEIQSDHPGLGRENTDKSNQFSSMIYKIRTIKENLDDPIHNVVSALFDVFQGKEVDMEQIVIPPYEKKLIGLVIEKLVGRSIKRLEKSSKASKRQMILLIKEKMMEADYNWLVKNILGNGAYTFKRQDEKVKFIFINTWKYLQEDFYKRFSLKKSRDREIRFLKHFFYQETKANKIDIRHYNSPSRLEKIKNPKHTSLSAGYFELIFKVEKFKKRFLNFLRFEFKERYARSLVIKIRSMFGTLSKRLENGLLVDRPTIFRVFLGEYSREEKLKLPWLSNQVEGALNHFIKAIEERYVKS